MSIRAGDCGPIFRVVDDATGCGYDGDSPTKPWTAVCVAKKLGTRISGRAARRPAAAPSGRTPHILRPTARAAPGSRPRPVAARPAAPA